MEWGIVSVHAIEYATLIPQYCRILLLWCQLRSLWGVHRQLLVVLARLLVAHLVAGRVGVAWPGEIMERGGPMSQPPLELRHMDGSED
jgi:hypothetical protein